MVAIRYEFDEIGVALGSEPALISGVVEVDYTMYPAEPDVGIMHSFPSITHYGPLEFKIVSDDNEPVWILSPDDPMYSVVFQAIEADVLEACQKDNEQ